MLRVLRFTFLCLLHFFLVSCNSNWTNQTIKNSTDLPEFQLTQNSISIKENFDPGRLINKVEVNITKCSSYQFNLESTFDGFFQIDDEGQLSLASSFPTVGTYSITIIAECNLKRLLLSTEIIVTADSELGVDFISNFPTSINASNVSNYIVSGTCSELEGLVIANIGGIQVSTQCINRNWSVAANVSTLSEGNVLITIIYTVNSLSVSRQKTVVKNTI